MATSSESFKLTDAGYPALPKNLIRGADGRLYLPPDENDRKWGRVTGREWVRSSSASEKPVENIVQRLSVLTTKDHIVRAATVALSAALLITLGAVALPASTIGGALIGLSVWGGFQALRLANHVRKDTPSPEVQEDGLRNAFKELGEKFHKQAGTGSSVDVAFYPKSSNIMHAEFTDNLGEAPHFIYSEGMRQRMSAPALASVMAHEIAHYGYDGYADRAHFLMNGGARTLRWALLGSVAKAALTGAAAGPAGPLVAAALLMPYAMNALNAVCQRNNEYVNDRFAATQVGSIVPVVQSHSAIKRFMAPKAPIVRFLWKKSPLLRAAWNTVCEPQSSGKCDLVAPFTNHHPSRDARRRALHKIQPQILNQPRRREIHATLKGLS